MHKLFTYLLLIGALLCTSVQAQDYDSAYAPPAGDSVGSIEDIIEDTDDEYYNEKKEGNVNFDPVQLEDKSTVVLRKVNDSVVNQMRKDNDFWYVNEVPQKEKPKQPKEESFLNALAKKEWFRNLLWILVVGGFVAVLIWFIISSDIQLFKKQAPAIVKQEEDEFINQSIFDINYDSEIQKAISNQNFRLAIRLLYLQTLKRLAEENIINYKQERTNSDYVMQLFNTSYYKDFFRLTRHFEYAWYGQLPVAPASFDVIQNEFSSFKQRFPS